ncbi:16147_t:CDS:1, partial [Gigaspora margarita]
MSKLRAKIIYKHHQQQNFKLYTNLEATTTLDTNKSNSNTNNKNGNEMTNENNNEMPNKNQLYPNEFNNEDNEEYSKLEEEIYKNNKEFISEKDFGEYLQGWAELLKEKQDNEDQ